MTVARSLRLCRNLYILLPCVSIRCDTETLKIKRLLDSTTLAAIIAAIPRACLDIQDTYIPSLSALNRQDKLRGRVRTDGPQGTRGRRCAEGGQRCLASLLHRRVASRAFSQLRQGCVKTNGAEPGTASPPLVEERLYTAKKWKNRVRCLERSSMLSPLSFFFGHIRPSGRSTVCITRKQTLPTYVDALSSSRSELPAVSNLLLSIGTAHATSRLYYYR